MGLMAIAWTISVKQPTKVSNEGEIPTGVVEANNQFAIDLYSRYKVGKDNIFFSPYSISLSLAMTYEGARGKTAREIQSVFHFPEDDILRRSGYAKLYDEINRQNKEYSLHTVNALWAQKDYKFLDDYFRLIEKYYRGKITNLNFKKNPEDCRKTINNWVKDQTNNKIEDLIPVGRIITMTKLVLTNAIYFKGKWINPFNKDKTREQNFRINTDNIVKVPMMQRTDEEAIFNYAENDLLQILELPYTGKKLSMLILLPKNDEIANLENSVNLINLSKWKKDLVKRRVKVFIPKFKFETKYFMMETLKNLGMSMAFTPEADLSGMDGTKNLYITDVIHQAVIEVNEGGTEAAAATAVITLDSAMPQKSKILTFLANHPFIFIIQEKTTENILFMGRVMNPIQSFK